MKPQTSSPIDANGLWTRNAMLCLGSFDFLISRCSGFWCKRVFLFLQRQLQLFDTFLSMRYLSCPIAPRTQIITVACSLRSFFSHGLAFAINVWHLMDIGVAPQAHILYWLGYTQLPILAFDMPSIHAKHNVMYILLHPKKVWSNKFPTSLPWLKATSLNSQPTRTRVGLLRTTDRLHS